MLHGLSYLLNFVESNSTNNKQIYKVVVIRSRFADVHEEPRYKEYDSDLRCSNNSYSTIFSKVPPSKGMCNSKQAPNWDPIFCRKSNAM